MKKWKYSIVLIVLIGCVISSTSAQGMFPGAEGFGAQSRGAYAGEQLPQIIKVTNLNDGGPGSLRAAINRQYPRIIIFEVSGVIELNRTLRINSPYVFIAAQTAPFPGITLKNYPLGISSHDVLVQGIKVRPGTASNKQIDGINIADDSTKLYNIMVDHCSVSWALDENIGILNGGDGITISNCIISECLTHMNHSKGLLSMHSKRISVIKNMFVHNSDRNPLVWGDTYGVQIINNLIYNSDTHAVYLGMSGEGKTPMKADIVGNYYILGKRNRNDKLLSIHENFQNNGKVYVHGNMTKGVNSTDQYSRDMLHNPGNKAVFNTEMSDDVKNVQVINATILTNYLIKNCGAQAQSRDEIDSRIINDVIKQTGNRIALPSEVGGWVYEAGERKLDLPAEPHADDDENGFTNIEEWLHSFL
ncbi:pectate lyase [Carboxylicivirga sp. A043]|uniref:pectate lyase n=1 Tax=Carboxylicivirga litoralis TaxID=2816963 RepID=UPI0021CB01B1|nr:pectate lyase [Carboxylicivirga sp. A043]MCU4155369.1 pectate lyase [Carboxylicivirga sp. A043]